MIDPDQLSRLIHRFQVFADRLRSEGDLLVHEQISHFFYLQKTEELKVLLDQLHSLMEKLEVLTTNIDSVYSCCFCQWRRDVRWLNAYRADRERFRTIL